MSAGSMLHMASTLSFLSSGRQEALNSIIITKIVNYEEILQIVNHPAYNQNKKECSWSVTTLPATGQKTHHPLLHVGRRRHSAPAEVFLSLLLL